MQRRKAGQATVEAGGDKSPRHPAQKKNRPKLRVNPRSLGRPNKGSLTLKNKSIAYSIVKYLSLGKISFLAPAPIPAAYDQIEISLYSRLPCAEVKQNFISVFGKPKVTQDRKFWIFSSPTGRFEVSRSRKKTRFYHIIKLRNLDLLPLLAPVMDKFALPPDGSPVAKLSSAEIAFDIPLPADVSYPNAEKILRHLVLFIEPCRNRYARQSIVSGPEFQDTADGAINGKYSFYVGKHKSVPYDEQNPKKNKTRIDESSTWQGKVYLKAFYGIDGNQGPWHIRFEVELSGKALKKIGGNYLSFDVDAMKTRLAKLALSDFWRAYEFDWKKFINEAQASYKQGKGMSSRGDQMAAKIFINLSGEIEPQDPDDYAAKVSQNKGRKFYNSTIRRTRVAYRIAGWLNDKQLTRRLWNKKFNLKLE